MHLFGKSAKLCNTSENVIFDGFTWCSSRIKVEVLKYFPPYVHYNPVCCHLTPL